MDRLAGEKLASRPLNKFLEIFRITDVQVFVFLGEFFDGDSSPFASRRVKLLFCVETAYEAQFVHNREASGLGRNGTWKTNPKGFRSSENPLSHAKE